MACSPHRYGTYVCLPGVVGAGLVCGFTLFRGGQMNSDDKKITVWFRQFSDWLDRTSETKEGLFLIVALAAGVGGLVTFVLVLAF
jgi:hypothetical protein